ncbi:hypothetical protein [Edaphobacter acidisoli]|nr:hypothetical protein [Edaphobacter acidisoli]
MRFALSASLLVLPVLLANRMDAQATAARSREAAVSAFGMFTHLTPDYGQSVKAFTAGGDYTRFYQALSPSLEVRFKTSSMGTVSERTFGGGIRVERSFSYFRPYADFLISDGTINFAQKYYIGANGTGTNGSVVYSYGGGLDYDFADQWAVRVDYQQESWNVNKSPAVTLAPRALSFGVLYRFRFHHPYQ